MLFAALLRLLCVFSVSIAFQRVGRFFGVSGHDPFRLCVVLVQVSVQSSSWIEAGRILMTNRVGTSIRHGCFPVFSSSCFIFGFSFSLKVFRNNRPIRMRCDAISASL